MKYLFWLPVFLLTLFWRQPIQAQDILPERYFRFGVGFNTITLQDAAVSAMIYRGSPITILLGFEKHKQHGFSSFSLSGDFGRLTSRYATDLRPMLSQLTQINLDYRRYWLLNRSVSAPRWMFGGMVRSHNSIRITPQNDTGMISFLIANSIYAGVRREFHVPGSTNRSRITASAMLPLLSHILRPSYLNLYNYLDPEHNWLGERFEDSEWLSFNRFPGLETEITYYYRLRGGSFLSASYNWSFYHYSGERRVNAGQHHLIFSSLLKF